MIDISLLFINIDVGEDGQVSLNDWGSLACFVPGEKALSIK